MLWLLFMRYFVPLVTIIVSVMKNLFYIALSAVIFSCQNQGKMGVQRENFVSIDSIKQASADSMTAEFEKQKVIDSMQFEMARIEEERDMSNRAVQTRKEVVVVNRQSPAPVSNNASTNTSSTTTAKKGWSSTAKGAVIGAGVGAATGAIISKKKVQGAIIGGIAGAGVGAGTGAIIDGSKKE